VSDDNVTRENTGTTEMPEEEIFRQRKDKLERLRAEEGYDPYANDHWDVLQKLSEVRGT
jgi:lysyl-tRNA synthetase class 2